MQCAYGISIITRTNNVKHNNVMNTLHTQVKPLLQYKKYSQAGNFAGFITVYVTFTTKVDSLIVEYPT